MKVKNRIKALLAVKNKTQRSLARDLGVTHIAVYKWCKNEANPQESSIVSLENALGVTKDVIFYLE
jgi:transcriptional regulator with XRE-family HTH domain